MFSLGNLIYHSLSFMVLILFIVRIDFLGIEIDQGRGSFLGHSFLQGL